jgi:hypothetical protein
MSIILRYLECTSDDYKSFVNFLNLKNNEILIDSEKLQIVLAGISEMTASIEQQRTILNNLIENKFNGVISRNTNSEQIFENAKKYAKTELEKQIEELKQSHKKLHSKHTELSSEFDSHIKTTSKELQQMKGSTIELGTKLSDTEKENKALKNKLIDKEFKEELWKWQMPSYLLILLGLVIIGFILLQFCGKTWIYNYSYKIVLWIDTINNTASKNILTWLMYTPVLGLWNITKYVWNKLGPSEKKKEKIKTIKTELKEKYK